MSRFRIENVFSSIGGWALLALVALVPFFLFLAAADGSEGAVLSPGQMATTAGDAATSTIAPCTGSFPCNQGITSGTSCSKCEKDTILLVCCDMFTSPDSTCQYTTTAVCTNQKRYKGPIRGKPDSQCNTCTSDDYQESGTCSITAAKGTVCPRVVPQ